MSDSKSRRITHPIVDLCCLLTLAIGASGLAGWTFQIPTLKSLLPNYVEMKANTAVGLIAASLGLWLLARFPAASRLRTLGRAFAWFIIALGSLTLFEYLAGRDLGIDLLLFYEAPGAVATSSPGRMACQSAINFILKGLCLLCLDWQTKKGHRPAQYFSLISAVAPVQALIAYGYGVKSLLGLGPYTMITQMAIHVAFAWLCLSLGMLFARPHEGFMRVIMGESYAGLSARRLLLPALALPIFAGWVVAKGTARSLYDPLFGFSALVLIVIVSFGFLVWKNASALDRLEREREAIKAIAAEKDEHLLLLQESINAREERDHFFKVSIDMFCIIGKDGCFKRLNPSWETTLGYSSAEILAQPWAAFVHPDDYESSIRELGKIWAGATSLHFENRYGHRDGSYRWLSWTCVLAGDVTYATARDVTEKKQTELTTEKFVSLVQNSSDFIGITSLDATVDFLNDAGKSLLGIDARANVAGVKFSDYHSAQDYKILRESVIASVLRDGRWQGDISFKHQRTGAQIPVLMNCFLIRDPKTGEPSAIATVSRDMRQRLKAEAELQESQRAAQEASRMKSEFLANMSHEIRTPLNGIIGMADLILEMSLGDRQRKYAKIIQDSGAGLLTIINDILDFSKIEAGKLSLEKIDFNVVSLIEGQVELLASRARDKDLAVLTFIDPHIPSVLQGDPGRIGQILMNLVGNAIKFTPSGKIVVRALLEVRAAEHALIRFSVKDTGIGLSSEAKKRLFTPFTQADGSTARKYGGTGLGLSISKRLASLMGGEINVETIEGAGSEFWFTVKVDIAKNDQREMRSRSQTLGHRVLVVDDEPVLCEIIHDYLEAWGMRPVTASNGQKGLEALRQGVTEGDPFAAAIIDWRMPVMDGMQLATEIRRDPTLHALRLLLVSGNFGLESLDSVMTSAFVLCLEKPVKQSELYNGLLNALGGVTQEPALPASAEAVPRPALDGFRILVAEDNPVNQLLVLAQLKNLGYSAQAVANGLEVLESLSTGRYQMVLMDCQMPEMDGFEATRRIRAREQTEGGHIPIIALTANAMKEDELACRESGMDDYVSKPVKKETLDAAIGRWIPASRKLG